LKKTIETITKDENLNQD
jgi:hypothetical protein